MRAFPLPALVLLAASVLAADVPREIPNLADVKAEIVRYHDSGQWYRDVDKVADQAIHWIDQRAKRGGKLAVVLDIDETSLDNWKEEKAMDFGYVGSLWDQWEKSGQAAPIPGVVRVFKAAKARHVAVFFVTGRHETSREGTERNLNAVGYAGYDALVMKPSTYHEKSVVPYKSSARAAIERKGYRIVANLGDQWSDLKGGHSEKTFKLPNPEYFIP